MTNMVFFIIARLLSILFAFLFSVTRKRLEKRVSERFYGNCALTRTSNTIAHGVTRKERAKTRLMQIFVRSSDARNLSASHNFEDTVAMAILLFATGISLRCVARKKISSCGSHLLFDERESGRQNAADGCHECRDYVSEKYA